MPDSLEKMKTLQDALKIIQDYSSGKSKLKNIQISDFIKLVWKASREEAKTRYEKDVLKSANENHLWINAMEAINPTDEFMKMIGREVLRKLGNGENLILSEFDGSAFESLKSKELILRINKS